ncbi:MAG TPA: cobaltochelatase subunit CobT, partial [Caulobacteraceae bacterium]|nr:cobaltochelatase subunit CobT [Caulobacteraceae bacterium]
MAKSPESPVEPFKRALAHAARSLAETPDLEIVYSGEGPSLTGKRAVLPHPPRDLTAADAARIRGLADQMALRLAHHDPVQHARSRPSSPLGQPVYDAIEQARVEAIGANALGGVRQNMKALIDQAWAKRVVNQAEAMANPPMAEVLSLLVRERLTGEPPPAAAGPLVDLFRADIEGKAGRDLDQLLGAIEDQKAYAKISRAILRDLQMAEDSNDQAEDAEDDEDAGDKGEPEANEESDDGEGEGQSPQAMTPDESETQRQESDDTESQAMEAEADPDAEEGEEPPEMGEGEQPARAEPKGEGKPVTYKVFTAAHDEIVAAEELCDAEELTRLR